MGRKSCFTPSHRVKTPGRIQLSSFVTDRGTKPAISTEQAWSIKNYYMANERNYPCRTAYAGNPERERWAHLPGGRVADQNECRIPSSCQLIFSHIIKRITVSIYSNISFLFIGSVYVHYLYTPSFGKLFILILKLLLLF